MPRNVAICARLGFSFMGKNTCTIEAERAQMRNSTISASANTMAVPRDFVMESMLRAMDGGLPSPSCRLME